MCSNFAVANAIKKLLLLLPLVAKSKLSKLINRETMKINKLNQKLSVPIERYTLI